MFFCVAVGGASLPQILNLNIKTEKTLNLKSGKHLHGLLFAMLADADPDIASDIHNNQEKPFSLWPSRNKNGSIDVLIATLSDQIANAINKNNTFSGVLGNTPVVVSPETLANKRFEELWNASFKIERLQNLRINFLSPTSFRRAGLQWLFPNPSLIFQNVYSKALTAYGDFIKNNLSPPTEYASQFMVSRYELNTKQTDFGRYKIIGFKGYCVYDCRRIQLAYHSQSLVFLSLLSEFTGIGYKTTMGMGHVKCLLNRS